jgi:hypothetical protein
VRLARHSPARNIWAAVPRATTKILQGPREQAVELVD